MITFEEKSRIKDRATGRAARWFGLTLAGDVVRLLDELNRARLAKDSAELFCFQRHYDWEEREALLADLAAAENRVRDWDLPIHRTEAGYPNCSTCDGGGCFDCTEESGRL